MLTILKRLNAVRQLVQALEADMDALRWSKPLIDEDDKESATTAYFAVSRAEMELQAAIEAFEYLVE